MKKITLKTFQQNGVGRLEDTILRQIKNSRYRNVTMFVSPTGSGKTTMCSDFITHSKDRLNHNAPISYIWISFGGDDLVNQSLNKINDYAGVSTFNKDDLTPNFIIPDGAVLGLNWGSSKATNKSYRKLRKPTETTPNGLLDEIIANTKKTNEIILFIDESHLHKDTNLAEELLKMISAKVEIHITATPKNYIANSEVVMIDREDVVKDGLVATSIELQTDVEIKNELDFVINEDNGKGINTEDKVFINLAIKKQQQLQELFDSINIDVTPAVLIQIPNINNDSDKTQWVKDYLLSKGVKAKDIAIKMSNKVENFDNFTDNDCKTKFVIFKTALGTGWDCPRAYVLVMFRDVSGVAMNIQLLGRIVRIPFGNHFDIPELNKAYLYTNYDKEHIIEEFQGLDKQLPTKINMNISTRKASIEPIEMFSSFTIRQSYNTLIADIFAPFFQDYFRSSDSTLLKLKEIDLTKKVIATTTISNASLGYGTDMIAKFKDADDTKWWLSYADTEIVLIDSLIDYLKTRKGEAMYNVSRSHSPLRNQLIKLFKKEFSLSSGEISAIIFNDIISPNSIIKPLLTDILIDFREKLTENESLKAPFTHNNVLVPMDKLSFNDSYQELDLGFDKCGYDTLYVYKNARKGQLLEIEFMRYIDSLDGVLWWVKQPDEEKLAVGIEYYNIKLKREKSTYSDFIIKMKDGTTLIIDTKSLIQADDDDTKSKAEGIQQYIRNQNIRGLNYNGGIVIYSDDRWYLNNARDYIFHNKSDWKEFNLFS